MKKYFFLLLMTVSINSYCQSSGIGTTSPDKSAALEVQSTTQGVLPPRMTTAQRDAMPSRAAGLQIYNTDINCLETYNGASWMNLCCTVADDPSVVYGAAGKKWMAYNLGATAPASSATDYSQFGSLYQWGRGSDGHQLITWNSNGIGTPLNDSTSQGSVGDTPGHGFYINSGSDWRLSPNNNLWNGTAAVNNPCPIGFRVPTSLELEYELQISNITSINDLYRSCLKFTHGGTRSVSGTEVLSYATYWTSTASDNVNGSYIYIGENMNIRSQIKMLGMPIRCIKD